jgi:antitoxin component of RelBE/YafQ-DinJ toxin-antitoxin module
MTKILKNELIQLRLDTNLKSKYLEYCEKNGYSISKRIRLLIRKDLKNEKKDD